MTFTAYHTTPGSNTSLASVSLSESQTKPKHINDMIRQILADAKFSLCWRVDNAAELQAVTFTAGTIPETVIVNNLGAFAYDSADTTTADNAETVLVTTSGNRYKAFTEFNLYASGELKVGGEKVVGAQQSAIANLVWTYSANDPATTANSATTFADGTALVAATAYEAFDEVEAKINAILAALRTHGLIDT
jgi:hypothetical protein